MDSRQISAGALELEGAPLIELEERGGATSQSGRYRRRLAALKRIQDEARDSEAAFAHFSKASGLREGPTFGLSRDETLEGRPEAGGGRGLASIGGWS